MTVTRLAKYATITFRAYRSLLLIVLTPTLLTLLPILVPGSEAKGAYILILMSVYWLTEAIPIYVTALIPAFLGPVLGLIPSSQLCPSYMKDTNMLFIGGLFLACAIEHRNLHRRLAIHILYRVGTDPKMLLLGFMLPTWFISMWMSNTATTAMMITISEAVLTSLIQAEHDSMEKIEHPVSTNYHAHGHEVVKVGPHNGGKLPGHNHLLRTFKISMHNLRHHEVVDHHSNGETGVENGVAGGGDDSDPDVGEQVSEADRMESLRKLGVGLSLAVCYSSTCGGIGTITGTGPNSVLMGLVNSRYGHETGLNFGSWMAYALPIAIAMLIIAWIWLSLLYVGFGKCFKRHRKTNRDKLVESLIESEMKSLGPFSYAEGACCVLFALITVLWITRKPGGVGWGNLFIIDGKSYITDTQPALLISLLALMLPAANPLDMWRSQRSHYDHPSVPMDFSKQFLLPWHVAQKKFPWGTMILLGGGFALSDICQVSGLSAVLGQALSSHLQGFPTLALVLVCSAFAAFLTELTSNVATASILLPIMFSMAQHLHIHPFLLAFPTTIATSFAFCLPAATPPNSIVFGRGRVSVKTMIRSGILINIMGSVVLLAAMSTYAIPLFHLDVEPDWAKLVVNATSGITQ